MTEKKTPEELAADLYNRLRNVLLEERQMLTVQDPDWKADYLLTALAQLLLDVAEAGGCRRSVVIANIAEMAGLKVEKFERPDGEERGMGSC